MGEEPIERDEVEALLAARQELGPSLEPALVDSFAEKIVAEARRLAKEEHQMVGRREAGNGMQLALAIVSLALAIPLTVVPLELGAWWLAIVSWVGIVLVNLAFALRGRDH